MLGKRIRDARLELGLTQAELAKGFFSRSYISKLENGLINPSIANLEIIAQKLGRTVPFFLPEQNDAGKRNTALLALAETLIGLGEYNRAEQLLSGLEDSAGWDMSNRAQYDSILAQLAYSHCDFEEALSLAESAVETYCAMGQTLIAWRFLYKLTHNSLTDKHYDFSIEVALRALSLLGNNYQYMKEKRLNYYFLGVLYYAVGRSEIAQSYFEQASVRPDGVVDIVRGMVSAACNSVDSQQWATAFRLAVNAQQCLDLYTLDKLTAQCLVRASVCLLHLGCYASAMNLLDEALMIPTLHIGFKRDACKQILLAATVQEPGYLFIEQIVLRFVIAMYAGNNKLSGREIREAWALISAVLGTESSARVDGIWRSLSEQLVGLQRYDDAAKVLAFGAKVLFFHDDIVEAYQMLEQAYHLSRRTSSDKPGPS